MTKNRLSFANSQTLLASENEFNSTENVNTKETVGDARRLDHPVLFSSLQFCSYSSASALSKDGCAMSLMFNEMVKVVGGIDLPQVYFVICDKSA